MNQAEALKALVDKVANVNEFNRREDEELNSQTQNLNAIEFGARQTKKGVSAKIWVLGKFTLEHL